MDAQLSEIQKEKLLYSDGTLFLDAAQKKKTGNPFSGEKIVHDVIKYNLREDYEYDLNELELGYIPKWVTNQIPDKVRKFLADGGIAFPTRQKALNEAISSEARKKINQTDVTNLEGGTLDGGYLEYEAQGCQPIHIPLGKSIVTLTPELKETIRNFARRNQQAPAPVEVQVEALQIQAK